MSTIQSKVSPSSKQTTKQENFADQQESEKDIAAKMSEISSANTTAVASGSSNYEPVGSNSPVAGGFAEDLNWEVLVNINKAQETESNKQYLDSELSGIDGLIKKFGTDEQKGLSPDQVIASKVKFGTNEFPESPMESFLELFIGAFNDPFLIVLMGACVVSIVLGMIEHPEDGYIEGIAIFIAVFLVAIITATNDYQKELQFRALERESQNDERVSVMRDGGIERINPIDLVVGDIIVLQAGDSIPADSIILDDHVIKCNEAGLTGEPDDLPKSRSKGDPFLLSSCLMTEGEECHALVIGIGMNSQWGIIKANLVTEAVPTPLQEKLDDMCSLVGYIGLGAAAGTLFASLIRLFTVDRDEYNSIGEGVINAFILSVTIVVVAIPEGLPLAVTIALAYSTKKMYDEKCLIRVLAACETMGNATNICSDKTGTLTENRMTVVEGWFGDKVHSQEDFKNTKMTDKVVDIISQQCALNRAAYLVYKDAEGNTLSRPNIIGNKTEGALILMAKSWGKDYESIHKEYYLEGRDQTFSFNSEKKRSTAIVQLPDGTVRLYCKGASEWIMKDATKILTENGSTTAMSSVKRDEMNKLIDEMANRALRTLCLAHKDYSSFSALPSDWKTNPPDHTDLIIDSIVGIIDPLRDDVKDAVATAQKAGVTVRMITGDNIATARAIAKQCGIFTEGGLVIEGPAFRAMTPKEVDAILPRLQVMGRSSPDDKYLLVNRLNGAALPDGKEEWEKKHVGKNVTWENDRDKVLPGYKEEWEASRPNGGQVVGVTGDGTNDAPALKVADVGLSMGITGTKVAQGASDIVIRDDKFSSIVKAIKWGRSVYDNIRKFLQFQLTVNLVALTLVFVAACSGTLTPLNAVQMLWVNLIMDTMGALALATEPPLDSMMDRKPYKRDASLVSWPMWRNILVQTVFQLIVVFILLYAGADLFGVHEGDKFCLRWMVEKSGTYWDVDSSSATYLSQVAVDTAAPQITCQNFDTMCPRGSDTYNGECYVEQNTLSFQGTDYYFKFKDLKDFDEKCLECTYYDYTHGSIIFNAFIFCQIFNEYTSRDIFDNWNFLDGIQNNYIFLLVSLFTVGAQIFLIEVGGTFVKTTSLTINQWLVTIALGAIGLPVGMLMRFIPVKEDPESFFDNTDTIIVTGSSSNSIVEAGGEEGVELMRGDEGNIAV